ncbi:MAG: hypothetical protein IJ690_02100 [Clostridia bacterium]|nr:hypothetical protein [Clostridia bacterium]MBR1653734.1 hypothetical protein [Clostridia bacterium]
MKKIIAKIDFTTNIDNYIAGDEITGLTYEQIVKLNEQGFIEPLEYRDLVLIKRELENNKKIKEEL